MLSVPRTKPNIGMDRRLLASATAVAVVLTTLLALWHPTPKPSQEAVILGVPFVKQKPWFCSEASASMLLQYYGFNLTQEKINAMGYDRFENMLPLIQQYLNASYAHLTLEELKAQIDMGRPVMVRLEINGVRHTVVVVGYDENYIYVNDPARGPAVPVPVKKFMKLWSRTDYLAIVAYPKQGLTESEG